MHTFLATWTPPRNFELGNFTIHYYGIMIILGLLTGSFLAFRRRKHYDIEENHLDNLILLLVPSAIVGARLLHVLIEWKYYSKHLLNIFNLPGGGIAIHGAILASILAVYIYSKITKLKFFAITDLLVPSLAIGQAIGRFGNFFNQELYGKPVSDNYFLRLLIDPKNRLAEYYNQSFYHPTFLYESLMNLTLFAILIIVAKKLKYRPYGVIFGLYLVGYGIIRFITESIRIDESALIGSLKLAHITSIILILSGLVIMALVTKPSPIKTPSSKSPTQKKTTPKKSTKKTTHSHPKKKPSLKPAKNTTTQTKKTSPHKPKTAKKS